jgi:nitroimidazol reductase NimA-like FMN-containing flavoprotein (pyridoxamine 5'-phosphate oxidase superfamily)
MTNAFELRGKVLKLLAGQPLAVLATHGSARSYASLVAFAFTDDLAFLVFATPRSTRKFANLQSSQNVAFLIDNRSNLESDFQETTAATVTGIAEEIPQEERSRFLKLYLARHPSLLDFVDSPTCALFRVRVDTYYIVTRFQEVAELHLAP